MSTTNGQLGPTGNRWGVRPLEQRQVELQETLRRWEAEGNRGSCRGPFDGTLLSGADVFWLAFLAISSGMRNKAEAEQILRTFHFSQTLNPFDLSELHLEGAVLTQAHLERANLRGAHLDGAILSEARLEEADLAGAHLEKADLMGAHLEKANLREAHLEKANLREASLCEAIVVKAELCESDLTKANLQRANLFDADLREGVFDEADLRGASLVKAKLHRANLSRTLFDVETNLADAEMGDRKCGFVSVIDTTWNGVNLASVDWSALFPERWWRPRSGGKLGDDQLGLRTSARAHRQLALALRSQGLNAEASELDYRAHIRTGKDLRPKARPKGFRPSLAHFAAYLPAYLASCLAYVVCGYGYRLWRCFAFYVGVVLLFSFIYWLIPYGYGAHSSPLRLPWWPQALILSFTSFHGRGFLPSEVTASVWHGTAAVGEAIVGLLLEATLIATFTQRIFR